MKRLITLSIIGAFLFALPASHVVFGKGHVPSKKAQVCHNGEVLQVGTNGGAAHLKHGDCDLPACDFNNVFHTGGTCLGGPAGGQCNVANPRADAGGITPGCPVGTF